MGYCKSKMKDFSDLNDFSSFEKYMLCKYLIGLIDILEINRYEFNMFYEKLIYVLNLDIKTSPKKIPVYSCNVKKEHKFRKDLKDLLVKHINNFSVRKNSFLKKINLISNLYDLSDYEYEYFLYYVLREINPLIERLEHFYGCETKIFSIFGVKVLKLKNWETSQISKQLVAKGIFIKRGIYDEKVFLNSKTMQIMSDNKIKTHKQIKNILLGSNLKSDLKWNDFDYLKKERDIFLNILTSAVNNKTKGINILLFGSVGTGKTQLSKLVANKAKIDIYSVSAEIMDKEATRTDRLNDLVSKQTILSKMDNSCILFDEAEDVMNRGFSEFGSASKAYLNTLIEETPVPIIWTTNNIYNVDPAFL